MKKPAGVSLIETLVIMSAASVILTLSSVTIHRVMQIHKKVEATHADEATAWRLSTRLRHDVHQASDALIEQQADTWRVTLLHKAAEPTIYRFQQETVSREQKLAEGKVARDVFPFAGNATWEIEELTGPPRLRIRTATSPGTLTRAAAPVKIDITARLLGARQAPEATP
ncbi:MAG: hypothetical protein AAGF31_06650 [Planctomycetota bacterium]